MLQLFKYPFDKAYVCSSLVSTRIFTSPLMAALDTTFGALLIGVIFATVLYGVTGIQTWYYFTHYPFDPWNVKFLVICTLLSDTCHQVLITHAIYTYLITRFGDYARLAEVVPTITIEVIFNGLTAFLVKCFLAMRVWRLSNKNWAMTGSVLVVILAEFILSLVFTIQALRVKLLIELKPLKPLSLAINATAAAGDLLIAVYLCFLLMKSRTGFQRSDSIIRKLVMFTVNTGLLTGICALGSLISYSTWTNTYIYVTFYFCIGRLYNNTLLTTLNAREELKNSISTGDMTLSVQGHTGTRSRLAGQSKRVPNNISIRIDTTRELVPDERHSSSIGDVKDFVSV